MNTVVEEATSLTVSRTFAASRERVFAAWTEPEQMKKWFGCATTKIHEIQSDLRTGGAYSIRVSDCSEDNPEEMTAYGVYREVTPPSKLVYTWQWADDPAYEGHETLVTVEFLAVGDSSTEVRLRHEGFPAVENRNNHEFGWTSCLEKLDAVLKG
jgi:uncharacterized protein YndB with AHSA1/START domain